MSGPSAPSDLGDFLLYGANGYTGELIARRAVAAGLRPVLAGRRADAIAALAAELGLPHRVASVDDPAALDAAVAAVRTDRPRLVLHCAGPFAHTARQVADACLRNRAHYLDITGEMTVFEGMAARGAVAERAGVMLLPGVGFDVVPSDCLAAYVARKLPTATRLVIAIQGIGRLSRGTALTSIENVGAGGAVRRGGRIVRVPAAWKTRTVDFGDGRPRSVTTMPWGDVSTAFHSTGIPNVEVYMTIPSAMRRVMRWGRPLLPLLASPPAQRWLAARVRGGPAGPNAEQRERGRSHFWAEASDDTGQRAAARLYAPEGYELTVRTAMECVQRVLRGDARPGFQTPSRAFGPDLVLSIDGVRREDA
ncbi:MAG TPA: saccharopine dehydrogenase NADP-binding domain-containing protein [Gemmatimonadaceae bacterium]|nr:saccharopine dehydrogenase NADP-binding domain-containing protein [Gemmatimonadaceae bacterium]